MLRFFWVFFFFKAQKVLTTVFSPCQRKHQVAAYLLFGQVLL